MHWGHSKPIHLRRGRKARRLVLASDDLDTNMFERHSDQQALRGCRELRKSKEIVEPSLVETL